MSGQYLRRYLLSIIMIVTFALILNGQDQPLMGLGGGGNISHFTGSRWTIFYQHSLGQKWGLRSSLNYIRKVNDYPFLLPDEGVDQIKTHSDYVQIDLGIRGSIDFEKTSLYFLTGPYAGLARKHQVRSISDEPPVESDDLELLDWDWGWYLSAGVRKQING